MKRTEKYKIKRDLYNSQFKKSHEERTYHENILVKMLYELEFLNYDNAIASNYRALGASEVVLVNEGYLTEYKDFEFIEVKEKILWFNFTVKEKYKDHIIRLDKKCLKDKGII